MYDWDQEAVEGEVVDKERVQVHNKDLDLLQHIVVLHHRGLYSLQLVIFSAL